MKLTIYGEKHPFKRELELLFDLFKSENDQVVFDDFVKDSNMVFVDHEIIGNKIEVCLSAKLNGQFYTYIQQKEIEDTASDKDIRRITKQLISIVWVQYLEEITGRKHDWGILTGIRPTKLYHQLYQSHTHEQIEAILSKDYLITPEKIALLRKIVDRQLQVLPDLYHIDQEVSLYIGIPFCPTKCAYCTFPAYAIGGKANTVQDFLDALHVEIAQIGKWLQKSKRKVTTIYFGGGTPTSIEADEMDDIFKRLATWIDLKQVREITVEAGRPDTITKDKLEILKKWGVGRISINPQTFTQETLDIIGRHHTVEETIEKYRLARDFGIENINMDLIIGLPGETLDELKESLNQIGSLQPESLTIHTMAFKRASFLTKNKEQFKITPAEEIVKMMEYANQWTQKQSYYPYYLYRQKNMLGNLENVGYALDKRESLYNILIMEEKQTIIGLGSGAVSKLVVPDTNEVIRYPSPKEPKQYIQNIETNIKKKLDKLTEIFRG